MQKDKLIRIQHFFSADVNLKKEMYNMAPPGDNGYLDEESICKYVDKLSDSIIYIFSELKCMVADMYTTESLFYEKLVAMEKTIKNEFYNCGLDINKLRSFYKNYISDMKPELVNEVKKEYVGYSFFASGNSLEMTSTVNEFLHVIHSCILNNENLLQGIDKVGEKINDNQYEITLRGINAPLFNQLFQSFPLDLDCGITDMIAVNEKKLLMMVRDRGHALTIEITLGMENARIEYFIPKLCNVNMINELPGVNRVEKGDPGATGVMEVPISELSESLFTFISKVPTDADMELITDYFANR